MINIIGLGATDENGLTLQTLEYIKDENLNYLRTEKVQAIEKFKQLNVDYKTFDYLYETEDTFDDVYEKIVEKLLDESKNKTINYFVPGTPLIAEKTVLKLIERTKDINLIAGVSFIEHVLNAVKRDPSKGFLLLDADDFSYFDINPRLDIMITQVYNMRTAVNLKLQLGEIYSDEYEVYFIKDAGLSTEITKKIQIYELDKQEYNHQCVIYIPKSNIVGFNTILDKLKQTAKPSNEDFNTVIKKLTDALTSLVASDLNGEYYIYDVLNEIYNKNL